MAALDRDQTLALLRVVCRAQNLLKGSALDGARAALPNDRQYTAFRSSLLAKEQGLRVGIQAALIDAGLIAEPLSKSELAGLK
jgi:hypothetical protein